MPVSRLSRQVSILRTLDFGMHPFLRQNFSHNIIRIGASTYSTQASSKYKRVDVIPTASAEEAFSLEDFKPRKHAGRFDLPRVELPEKFLESFKRITLHEDLKGISKRAELLYNYLKSRKLPVEEDEYKAKVTSIEQRLQSYDAIMDPFLSEEQKKKREKSMDDKIRYRLKKSLYHWQPIDYTHSKCLEYILARSAGQYAALVRIFKEIATTDPEFQPQTLFDFGSGAGTVLWAAHNCWSQSLNEHMCVDISREMNDIAELILRRGSQKNETVFPGVFFRQFFPVSVQRKYNLVVSAYSLLELPTGKVRLETVEKLWRNTNKYLVLVEQGTNSGFVALNEARDYILQLHKTGERRDESDEGESTRHVHGYTFSPCPHDTWCPRYMRDYRPCNFSIGHKQLYPFFKDETHTEIFSYVVLRKGERSGRVEKWPRLVKDPLKRGGHVICRLCTGDGELAEAILTKNKHPRKLYRCARMSSCGDLLPVDVVEPPEGAVVDLDREFEEQEENIDTISITSTK